MLITYVDESERAGRYYFVGAIIVDPTGLTSIEQALDEICLAASRKFPTLTADIEIHGYEIFHGEGSWKGIPPRLRIAITFEIIHAITKSGAKFVITANDRYSSNFGDSIHENTLIETLSLVEKFVLEPLDMRSMVIADDHHTAESSRRQFQLSRRDKTTNSGLHRFADTIYFGPSAHSRLLQAADLVTFLVTRSLTVKERDHRSATAMRKLSTLIGCIAVTQTTSIQELMHETPAIGGGSAAAGGFPASC